MNKVKRSYLNIGCIFVVILGALAFRRPDAFTAPQLWAEDGNIFFKQFEELGFLSLFKPYNGYLHFVPRLIAIVWGGLRVSYTYIPTLYNWSAFGVTFFIAIHLWKTSLYLGIKHRIAYAVFFVFLPLSSEIFMTITNINWFVSIFLINFLLTRYTDHNRKNYYGALVLLLIAGLTGPFSTLMAPIVLLTLFIERKSMTIRKIIPLAVVLFCGAVQLVCIRFIDPNIVRTYPGIPEKWHLLKLPVNNVNEIFMLDYFPAIPGHPRLLITSMLFLLLTVLFVICYRKITAAHKYVLPLTAFFLMAAFIKTYWPNESLILGAENSRYYFIPYVCIGWVFFLALDARLKRWHMVAGLCYLIAEHRHTRLILPDKHWKQQVIEYKQGIRDSFEEQPDHWKFTINKKK